MFDAPMGGGVGEASECTDKRHHARLRFVTFDAVSRKKNFFSTVVEYFFLKITVLLAPKRMIKGSKR